MIQTIKFQESIALIDKLSKTLPTDYPKNVQLESSGDSLTVRGTGSGTILEINIPHESSMWSSAASTKSTLKILRSIKAKEIALENNEKGGITIQAGKRKFGVGLGCTNPDALAPRPISPEQWQVSIMGDQFRQLLYRVNVAANGEDSRNMNSVLLVPERGILSAVATDGHRIHVANTRAASLEVTWPCSPGWTTIPTTSALFLEHLLGRIESKWKSVDEVSIAFEEGKLCFEIFTSCGTTVNLWIAAPGEVVSFPPYQRLIDMYVNVELQFTIDQTPFTETVKLATKLSDKEHHRVSLNINEDRLVLSVENHEDGIDFEEEIPIKPIGYLPEHQMWIDSSYLLDTLQRTEGEVMIKMSDDHLDPITVEDNSLFALIMPIKP